MAKIMLVEDDNNLREIYGARLLAEGHEIVAAKDGEEALAMAVKEKPDLIISDVMMPRISGFDMLDILRNAPETRETKVIMMTALSQAEDKARADQLGADRYLVKSQVTLEDVARVVRDVLEGKAEAGAAPLPEVSSSEPTPSTPAPQPTVPPSAGITPASDLGTQEIKTEDTAVTPPTAPTPLPTPDPAIVSPTPTPVVPNPDPAAATTTTQPDPVTPPTADESPPQTQTDTPVPKVEGGDSDIEAALTQVAMPSESTAEAQVPTASASGPSTPAPGADPIKVELPTPLDETPPAPAEPPAPKAEEPPHDESFVGPSVTEALEQEANEADQANTPIQAQAPKPSTSIPVTEAPKKEPPVVALETPNEPPAPTPVITKAMSGTPMVTPTPETPPATPPPKINPSSDGSTKKLIIQPINDITKGPDLDSLLQAEVEKAAVENPAASTIITPQTPNDDVAPPPSNASSDSTHDQIAL
jgi:CheY-like chemotaxis protein